MSWNLIKYDIIYNIFFMLDRKTSDIKYLLLTPLFM